MKKSVRIFISLAIIFILCISCKGDYLDYNGSTIPIPASRVFSSVSTYGADTAILASSRDVITLGTDLYFLDENSLRKIDMTTGYIETILSSFDERSRMTTDGTNLYISNWGYHTIEQVNIATLQRTVLAGSYGVSGIVDAVGSNARFNYPTNIVYLGTYLYVLTFHSVRRIDPSNGTVTTIAGVHGTQGYTDATGTLARFRFPNGLATDGTNLYVADSGNNVIREIDISTGAVTTLAGSGASATTDGVGLAASFSGLYHMTSDGTYLYVSEFANSVIRRIEIATADVITFAGTLGASTNVNGIGLAAKINQPQALTTDGTNLYFATSDYTIRKIVLATAEVSTFAGISGLRGFDDGLRTGRESFNSGSSGITSDGTNLYISDSSRHIIRKMEIATGTVTILAGTDTTSGSADGIGTAASFNRPRGLATDGTNLYVADNRNHTIRKIEISTGTVTTIAGTVGVSGSADGIGTAASFNYPNGITSDGLNLYVTDSGNDTIRKIEIATGDVTTFAGTAGVDGSTDGIGPAASFSFLYAITTDGTNLYVTDNGNSTIRKIEISTRKVTLFTGTTGAPAPEATIFYSPLGITTDGIDLYVIDNSAVKKIGLISKKVTVLTGTPGTQDSVDGDLESALFNYSQHILYISNKLFVTDSNSIRWIE